MEGPSGTMPRSALISDDVSFDTSTIKKALLGTTSYGIDKGPSREYSLYDQRYMPNGSGMSTIRNALYLFDRVEDTGSSSGARLASRELFYKSNTTEAIDFCGDILDSSRAPYGLDCLQKTFLQSGGKKTGTMYPTETTLAQWNQNPTWLSVKHTMKALTTTELYGLPIRKPTAPLTMPGVEIFWFRNNPSLTMTDGGIFLGRRIRSLIPSMKIKPATISMMFVCSIQKEWKGEIGVTSDDIVAVHLNQPIGSIRYKPGLQQFDSNTIVSITHQPPTRWSHIWQLSANQQNVVSGFWFQGNKGTNFQLEYNDTVSHRWKSFSADSLFLTQEPYAPMVSFEVHQSPQDFGGDFNFADRRMGGLTMKWHSLTGTPGWVYGSESEVSYIRFRHDSSITLNTTFKMYSFMTMTILIVFHGLPNNSVNSEECLYMNGVLGRIAIRVIGTGTYGQGVIQLHCDNRSIYVKTIRQDVQYLVVLRVNRSSETDIYSLYGLSMDIEEISILQENPAAMQYSAKIVYSSPTMLSNPDTMESRNIVIGNARFQLAWLRLYDYYLDSVGITKELEPFRNR